MSGGHDAHAVRPRPPQRGFWRVQCPKGCTFPRVASKEAAEVEAMKHRIRAALTELRCQCFHGDEFDPAGPCPRCQIIDALGGVA